MKNYITICFLTLVLYLPASAQPELDISPNPLKFGYISEGGMQQRNITIYNIGDQTAEITGADALEVFDVRAIFDIEIEPGDSAVVPVVFTPTSEGDFDSWIYISYGEQFELPIVGYGIRQFEPGEIIWSFQHIENVECVAAAEDYNGDGLPDVVAEGFDAGASGDPLVCLSGSGFDQTETIWSVHPQGGPSNSGGYGDKCMVMGDDLNDDGHRDILRGTAYGCRTAFAIDGLSGETIWSFDTYEYPDEGWVYAMAQMGDVNDDGVGEVLAGIGSNGDRAFCLDGVSGEMLWRYDAEDAISSVQAINDIDGDGYDDAVFAEMDYGTHVYCVSGASEDSIGTVIWSYDTDESVYDLCIVNDIDDDGYQDVVAGTWGGGVIAISGLDGFFIWRYPVGNYVMRVIPCPDLDEDGYEDIVVGSWGSYTEVVSGRDGGMFWRTFTGNNTWTVNHTGDINRDGKVEIIAGSFTESVYLMDGMTGDILWTTDVGAKPFSVRGIADINGDGYDDVIAGTQMLGSAGGEVFVLSGWRSSQTSVDDDNITVPSKVMLATNSPNPFNSATIIEFNSVSEADYNIRIYDIGGRLVDCISGHGIAGDNSVTWDLSDRNGIATGVYFYKITSAQNTVSGKMTYLK